MGLKPLTIEIEISDKRINDTLASAFEGGSNYWARIADRTRPHLHIGAYVHEVPMAGGWVQLECHEAPDMKPARLDREAVQRGLKLMAEKHPRHFADMVSSGGDATTGDVLLQLCVFGQVVFG